MLRAVGSAVAAGALYMIVRRRLPRYVPLPDFDASPLLVDRVGAYFGAANLFICLILLAASPALDWDAWLVALISSLVQACYNFMSMVGARVGGAGFSGAGAGASGWAGSMGMGSNGACCSHAPALGSLELPTPTLACAGGPADGRDHQAQALWPHRQHRAPRAAGPTRKQQQPYQLQEILGLLKAG